MKSRGRCQPALAITVVTNLATAIDMPFILLPFRPTSDTSASRNFIRNFFKAEYEGTRQFRGEGLAQELRLAEPLVCQTAPESCSLYAN